MSKKHIEAVVKAQYKALNAKDNKERLGYMIAGIEDGQFYTHANGKQFGMFDPEVPDTVFIPKTDLELSRITGTKIASITQNMEKFFDKYYGLEDGAEGEAADGDDESCDKPAKEFAPEAEDEPETGLSDENIEDLTKAFKKALKKEDFKKASKILGKLVDTDGHKKLSKKLAKAQ